LGNTSNKQIEIVKEILNHNDHKFKSFTLQITGLGLFYHDKKPSVIWAGIAENEELRNMFSIIEKQLLVKDFKLESRSFKPHITMGKIKYTEPGNTLKNTIKNYENTYFQDTAIDELYFYESILHAQGALYVPLSVIKF